jgi:CRISPR-associated protein Csd2
LPRSSRTVARLIVLEHASELGNAPAHRLFDRVKVQRRESALPARDFSEYAVTVETLPAGVTRVEMLP